MKLICLFLLKIPILQDWLRMSISDTCICILHIVRRQVRLHVYILLGYRSENLLCAGKLTAVREREIMHGFTGKPYASEEVTG